MKFYMKSQNKLNIISTNAWTFRETLLVIFIRLNKTKIFTFRYLINNQSIPIHTTEYDASYKVDQIDTMVNSSRMHNLHSFFQDTFNWFTDLYIQAFNLHKLALFHLMKLIYCRLPWCRFTHLFHSSDWLYNMKYQNCATIFSMGMIIFERVLFYRLLPRGSFSIFLTLYYIY